jgi:AcrR family transcriptional regulator
MPRSRAVTRARIVEGAYGLFYRAGFARVSMDEIAARAGVTKRTLYAHYDSKDSLLADVLENHHQLALARIETWAGKLAQHDPSSIEKFFSDLAMWSARRYWSGAGFTRLVMELADLPGHPARKIARRHKAAVEARLAAAFGSAQAGAEIMLLMEGTLALLLVHGDRRYAEIATAAAKKLMRSYQTLSSA